VVIDLFVSVGLPSILLQLLAIDVVSCVSLSLSLFIILLYNISRKGELARLVRIGSDRIGLDWVNQK